MHHSGPDFTSAQAEQGTLYLCDVTSNKLFD